MTDDKTRLAEAALRHSEARFKGILAIAADAIISVDSDQRINLFNEGAEKTFGYQSSEVIGQLLSILIPERFHKSHAEHFSRFGTTGEYTRKMGHRQEILALHKDGHEFPAEATISKFEIDGEKVFTVVLRDVSERKANEAALRESEQRLWAFLNNNSIIGWMKDEAGRYVFVSGTFQRRFRSVETSWIGKTDADVWARELSDQSQEYDRRVLAENRSVESVQYTLNDDGSRVSWLTHRFPFRDARGRRFVGGLAVDISERVSAEEALAKSHAELEARVRERTAELQEEVKRLEEAQTAVARLQRLEALGQLTGGVAHDFNNLLTVISGNLQLIGMDLEDAKQRKYLEEAERAVEMGARLNQRLMTFAKQRRLAPKAVDLNEQVIGVRELLRRSLGETIALSTELAEELWTVRVDPSEIENALVNLAINARDAMPEGGKLVVSTANVKLTAEQAKREEGLSPGNYVLLTVADTGSGMAPEVKARAFEPFFTTKPSGKGTGLGLATIYGFVKQSGGHVALESEIGKGTSIKIFLPRWQVEGETAEETRTSPHAWTPHAEMILVVEDNHGVRRVTVERIKALGYRTTEAENGAAALKLLEDGPLPDLVFSDVVMPGGMTGFDLARLIKSRWPHLKVLLTSGFLADAATAGDELHVEVLGKPYSGEALEKALTKALSGPAPA